MKDIKVTLLQTQNIEYVKTKLGREPWIQVCGDRIMNDADAGFWCGFIDVNNIAVLFRDVSWDISANQQGLPGFEGNGSEYIYRCSSLDDGLEALLFYREFYGVKPNYVELSQEFILLNNLRYDSSDKKYWAMYDSGESEEAVRYIDDCTVEIKAKFLHKYAAAKQLAILLFFDIRTTTDGKLSDYGIEEINTEHKTDMLYYGFWNGDMNCPDRAFSVLMGKKIIMPGSVESCGFWPYEPERTYEEFIIGMDQYGNERKYTCDPDKLANYFGANPGAPMYLTPVFFKKEVLRKYISKPELYAINDGFLECKRLWRIEIDNHHKNCISVYLGDLGRDLPAGEQSYWKSFNIIGEEGLSKEAFQRDFLNMAVSSSMEDHIFQRKYNQLSVAWKEKFGWELFLPLSKEDQYNLSQIHIPLTNSQPEFDQLVLSLVKVLIDSLNEKMLQRDIDVKKDIKGISKLEAWLQEKGAVDYQGHIKYLRDLQELRSSGAGHRKGKSYEKVAKQFNLDSVNLIDAFEEILHRANDFLNYMICSFLPSQNNP